MLPISALVAVAATIDETGSSPLALEAAQAWGWDSVRFLRSSATHAFAAGRRTDAVAGGVLRLLPAGSPQARAAGATSSRCDDLARRGAPVAPGLPRSTDAGVFAVDVHSQVGRHLATSYRFIAGESPEITGLSSANVEAWGEALATLHAVGSEDPSPERGLEDWLDRVQSTVERFAAELGTAAESIATDLQALPRDRELIGLVHGDPETDNVVWTAGRPTFVDLDDMTRSWFAADVAFALRDLAPTPQPADLAAPVVQHFLSGYRRRRPMSAAELSWWPLFGRAHALIALDRLRPVAAEAPAATWPRWAHALHARIRRVARDHEAALVA